MSKIIYHNHHIVPKYRCKEIGIDPDFPENIIRLTRLEHGQAHYERWLKHKDPRDLSAAQITTLYNSGTPIDASSNSGNYTSSSNLKGYWRLNEGTGSTVSDLSGNGNNGTIIAMVKPRCTQAIRLALD